MLVLQTMPSPPPITQGIWESFVGQDHRFHGNDRWTCPAVKFTVVIPTWNEEGWLPGLLSRLRTMKRVAHVVVADNWSGDHTRDIAIAEGAQIVDGGTPGKGRNSGAEASDGEYIVFADADAVFTSKALDLAAAHFVSSSNVVAVHFPLRALGATWFPRFCYKAMDTYFWILGQFGIAQGVGTFLAVRRSAFVESEGFNEGFSAGEDADLVQRLGHLGAVRYDRSIVIGTSPRRFLAENELRFALKTALWAILRLLGLRASWLLYRWIQYPPNLSEFDSLKFEEFFEEAEGMDHEVRYRQRII
jgi:glycosyltransferase involved in cell wall biosynthesis